VGRSLPGSHPRRPGAGQSDRAGDGGGGKDDDEDDLGLGGDNWPDDPPWDYYPAPVEWEDPIDILFDPWAGASYGQAFTDPETYYAQYYELRRLSSLAYMEADLNLRMIVNNATLYGANNPLTETQAIDLMGSITFRKGWRPYTEFLRALGLDPGHITNYEPRFMEGLMVANKVVLKDMQNAWRSANADPLTAEMRQFLLQRKPGFTP